MSKKTLSLYLLSAFFLLSTAKAEVGYVEISRYADPLKALVDQTLFDRDHLVESKFVAGIVEKLEDDHTDSRLYKEFRDEYKKRGIYQDIKALEEIDESYEAKDKARELYLNFLSKSPKDQLLEDEVFAVQSDVSHDGISLFVNTEDKMIYKTKGESYFFGFVDSSSIQGVSYLDKDLTVLPFSADGEKALIIVENKDYPLCNQDLSFFNCKDGQSVNESEVKVAAILTRDDSQIDTEALFNLFSNKSDRNVQSFLDNVSSYFEHRDESFNLDIPLIQVRGDALPSDLRSENSDITETIEKDYRYTNAQILGVISRPTQESGLSVTFQFKKDQRLKPNESLYFVLPKHFQNSPISSVIIGHRQNPRDQRGVMTMAKNSDRWPGYTSVQLHSLKHNYSKSWRGWAGPVSGPERSKFAEIKKSPEFDNLYEWPHKGHKDIKTGQFDRSLLFSDLVKIKALGEDPIYLSEVTVKLVPPLADHYEDRSFTHDDTRFGDPITMKGRQYGGGGNRYRGTFPGAVKMNPRRNKHFKIDVAGKNVRSIDFAVGDTKPDGVINKDGGYGSLGAAKVSIFVKKKGQKEVRLVDHENVGPHGVVTTYNTINDIDEIIIEVHQDTMYLMGYRYGYDD